MNRHRNAFPSILLVHKNLEIVLVVGLAVSVAPHVGPALVRQLLRLPEPGDHLLGRL